MINKSEMSNSKVQLGVEVNGRVGLRAGREGGMGVVVGYGYKEMTSHEGEKEMGVDAIETGYYMYDKGKKEFERGVI